LVAVDISNIPELSVRNIPVSTWFRFSRVVEKQPTALANAHPERCCHGVAGVGIARIDMDGSGLRRIGDVRTAGLRLGKVQATQVESLEGASSHASVIGGVHARLARKDALSEGQRLCVSERKARRQEAAVSIHHGAEIPAPRRNQGWCDCGGLEGALWFHNFRHSLATALAKLKVDPKTVQGMLRHEDFGTIMELYAQSDMESMRDAQGKFLEQLMGDKIYLLTRRVQ
jgi:integrase